MTAATSDPLQVLDVRKLSDAGKRVLAQCVEPSSCLKAELHGQSVAVNAAVEALERIHQAFFGACAQLLAAAAATGLVVAAGALSVAAGLTAVWS